jgi:asparagine synthase (glutamine-hydrolysing)
VVTVALSGDGGDELFGGYPRYHHTAKLLQRARLLPGPLRRAASASASRLASLPRADPWRERLAKLASLALGSEHSLGALSDVWSVPSAVAPSTAPARSLWDSPEVWPRFGSFVEQMMYVDTALSLPEQMLTKVDRASMRSSLEVRVPLVAPSLVEFGWSLRPEVLIGADAPGKALLRELVTQQVPVPIEPKRGFDPPIGAWLRGPLRPWCSELLDRQCIERAGVLDGGIIDAAWKRVLAGSDRDVRRVWGIVCLRAWARSHSVTL